MILSISNLVISKPRVDNGAGAPPANTVAPSIPTSIVVGTAITINAGTWTNAPTSYNYKGYRGATLISDQTSASTSVTYTPLQADAGNTSNIKWVVTATNSGGSASADSNTVAQILDANANAYMQAVSVSNNSTIYFASTAQQRTGAQLYGYYNTFFIALKAGGVYSKITSCLRPRWGTATANKFNLVNPADSDAAFRAIFNGSWTFDNKSAIPNATNTWVGSRITPSTHLTNNNYHIGHYSLTQDSNTSVAKNDGSAVTGTTMIGLSQYGATPYFKTFLAGSYNGGGYTSNNNTNTIGFLLGTRTANNVAKAFFNGVQQGTTQTTVNSNALPTGELAISASRNSNSSITEYSTRAWCFWTCGLGLSDAEVLAYDSAIQALNTSEGI